MAGSRIRKPSRTRRQQTKARQSTIAFQIATGLVETVQVGH